MGFVIPSALYFFLLFAAGRNELNPRLGSLPTTQLARYGYDAIYRPIYTDMNTGEVVPNYKPNFNGTGGGGMPSIAMTGEFPIPSEYMTSVHACYLLLVGTMGAMYALALHSSQNRSRIDG